MFNSPLLASIAPASLMKFASRYFFPLLLFDRNLHARVLSLDRGSDLRLSCLLLLCDCAASRGLLSANDDVTTQMLDKAIVAAAQSTATSVSQLQFLGLPLSRLYLHQPSPPPNPQVSIT
eukprot:c21842_g1_i1.p1 GENE.c21842_g1_i1~~c21842_g1_i1.p1  ORF type:complete len:120 (+),score=20.34 c21842_g1_i1:112-471(+)